MEKKFFVGEPNTIFSHGFFFCLESTTKGQCSSCFKIQKLGYFYGSSEKICDSCRQLFRSSSLRPGKKLRFPDRMERMLSFGMVFPHSPVPYDHQSLRGERQENDQDPHLTKHDEEQGFIPPEHAAQGDIRPCESYNKIEANIAQKNEPESSTSKSDLILPASSHMHLFHLMPTNMHHPANMHAHSAFDMPPAPFFGPSLWTPPSGNHAFMPAFTSTVPASTGLQSLDLLPPNFSGLSFQSLPFTPDGPTSFLYFLNTMTQFGKPTP